MHGKEGYKDALLPHVSEQIMLHTGAVPGFLGRDRLPHHLMKGVKLEVHSQPTCGTKHTMTRVYVYGHHKLSVGMCSGQRPEVSHAACNIVQCRWRMRGGLHKGSTKHHHTVHELTFNDCFLGELPLFCPSLLHNAKAHCNSAVLMSAQGIS
jgi:hypothetical protein